MTPNELSDIIEKSVQGQLNFYFTIALIIFSIGVFFVFFFDSYMKTKGRNFATKEDSQMILEQLAAQVKKTEEIKAEITASQVSMTEKIKSDISNKNWKYQEWNKTRRVKLEELVSCAFELQQLIREDAHKVDSHHLLLSPTTRFDTEPTAVIKIEMLSLLYFPELFVESIELCIAFRTLQQELIHIFDQSRNAMAVTNIRHSSVDYSKMNELHKTFLEKFDSFRTKAKQTLKLVADH